MSNKRWDYIGKTSDKQLAEQLAKKLNIPPIIATILVNRNILTESDAMAYLGKGMSGVRHPLELKDMQKAVTRIKKAIESKEQIVIYGDYDVDGITSTAIVYKFLSEQNANVSFYIPNRSDEGYGINMLALQKIKKTAPHFL